MADRSQIVAALRRDEPDYSQIAGQIGGESASILSDLASGDDLELATKAASLAPFMDASTGMSIIEAAAGSPHPTVRMCAAASFSSQPELSADLVERLIADSDAGVRKWTLRSIRPAELHRFRDVVQGVADNDAVPGLRTVAGQMLD